MALGGVVATEQDINDRVVYAVRFNTTAWDKRSRVREGQTIPECWKTLNNCDDNGCSEIYGNTFVMYSPWLVRTQWSRTWGVGLFRPKF